MLNRDDVRKVLSDTVFGFDLESIEDDQEFIEVGIDSLDHINFLLGVEEFSGVEIPDDMVEHCSSINNILKYVNK